MLRDGCSANHVCKPMIDYIHQRMQKDWSVKIIYCYREANRVADRTANFTHSLQVQEKGMLIFRNPPTLCKAELQMI